MLDAGINTDFYLQRHIFNIIVGIVLALIVSRFSFRTARAYAIIIYGVAVVGLMLVLVPGIGKSQGGAQAWIALPGGFGTLDELFEILTWAQLGIHTRPIALLNSGGFFDQLLGWINHVANSGFIRQHDTDRLLVGTEPEQLLELLLASHAVDAPPSPPKWADTR